jgi:hypothetical protein
VTVEASSARGHQSIRFDAVLFDYSGLRLRRAYVHTRLRPSASYDIPNDSYDVNGRQDTQIILQASDGHIVFPSFSMRFFFLVFCDNFLFSLHTKGKPVHLTQRVAFSSFNWSNHSERAEEVDGSVQVDSNT